MLIDKYKKSKKIADNISNKFYTVSAAVYSVLGDLEENESRFHQFLNYGLEAVRDWNIDMAKEVHTIEKSMNDVKQLKFPSNMIDWSKVGVRCGDMIKTFTNDRNISRTFDKDASGDKIANTSCDDIDDLLVGSDPLNFYYVDENRGLGYKYFGYSAHKNYLGYFDVDRKNRLFTFKDTVTKDKIIYLEYISDGINYSGHTIINPNAFKMIKLYIKWMRVENSDRAPISVKSRAEKLYYNELRKVGLRQLDLTIDDLKEAIRSGYTLVPEN